MWSDSHEWIRKKINHVYYLRLFASSGWEFLEYLGHQWNQIYQSICFHGINGIKKNSNTWCL